MSELAVHEPLAGEALSMPIPAPRIADILADPASMAAREHEPLFAVRNAYTENYNLSDEADRRIVVTTEAHALRDLDEKLGVMSDVLQNYATHPLDLVWADMADKIRHGLRFIGRREFDTGSTAIAQRWLDKLNASQAGELFVGLSVDASPIYVYQAVMRALEGLNPDAAKAILPIGISKSYLVAGGWARMQKAGLVILDDWTISGLQAGSRIGEFLGAGFPGAAVEVDVIAGAEGHISKGFRTAACKAYYSYPVKEGSSVTGAHGETDFGFRDLIGNFYGRVRSLAKEHGVDPVAALGYEPLTLPLLASIARVYKDNKARLAVSPEAAAIFKERQARCQKAADSIGRRLVREATA